MSSSWKTIIIPNDPLKEKNKTRKRDRNKGRTHNNYSQSRTETALDFADMAACRVRLAQACKKTPMSFYSPNLSPVETGLISGWETIWEKYCTIECFHVTSQPPGHVGVLKQRNASYVGVPN